MKKKLIYFVVYSVLMFLMLYFFTTNKDLFKSIVITIISGIVATFLTFWIVSKRS